MFARARDRPTERSHSRKICVLLICTKDWIDSNGILCIHECEYGKKEIQKCVWNIALCVPGLNVHIYTYCIAHSPDASSNALCVFCTHMVCTVRCFVYIGNVHAACYFIFRLFLGFSVWFCSVLLLLLLYGKFRLRAVSLTCSNHFPLIEYFFSFCSFFTSSSFSCSRICCVQKTLFVLLSLSCSLSIAFGRARFRSSCYFSSLFVVFSSFQFDHVLLFLKQFFFLLFSLLFLFSL